ncbi:IclR family transcriptional regulator domain-containing protein [Saccharopolyspora sp. 5N708]|uniref:IclR family transcriptional regulator domain-containing protein n=1 Tax=Saccharopolyspora sp. 5N708 TaxID=3457424 RepID=UPI003FCF6012
MATSSGNPDETRQSGASPKPRREVVGGLAKGLAIIEAFDAHRPKLTVSSAAAITGTTPAAARRCLLTLEELGYVTHDGKYFRPTPRIMRLSASYSRTASLPMLAQPCLSAVRDELGESASIAVLDDGYALFIERAEATRLASAGVRVGTRLPAYASSTGRVLLAALPDEEFEAYLESWRPQRLTPNSPATIAEIRRRVQRTRDEGMAFTEEELEPGVLTVAVPVRDSLGRTHAAMSVSTSTARASLDVLREKFLPVVRREAARLGNTL